MGAVAEAIAKAIEGLSYDIKGEVTVVLCIPPDTLSNEDLKAISNSLGIYVTVLGWEEGLVK